MNTNGGQDGALMKALSIIFLFLAGTSLLKAEQSHLTKAQVKQIAALVAEVETSEPLLDAKSGTWVCSAGVSGPSFGLIIAIRDKDGFYKRMSGNKKDNDFKIERRLKRRIDKIMKSNGEQVMDVNRP